MLSAVLKPDHIHKIGIRKLLGNRQRRVHVAEAGGDNQVIALQGEVANNALCVRAFGHVFNEGRLRAAFQFSFQIQPPLIVRIRPAEVFDWGGIDEGDLQRPGHISLACHIFSGRRFSGRLFSDRLASDDQQRQVEHDTHYSPRMSKSHETVSSDSDGSRQILSDLFIARCQAAQKIEVGIPKAMGAHAQPNQLPVNLLELVRSCLALATFSIQSAAIVNTSWGLPHRYLSEIATAFQWHSCKHLIQVGGT